VQADVELVTLLREGVEATASLVVLLKHANAVAATTEERSHGQTTETRTDDDDIEHRKVLGFSLGINVCLHVGGLPIRVTHGVFLRVLKVSEVRVCDGFTQIWFARRENPYTGGGAVIVGEREGRVSEEWQEKLSMGYNVPEGHQ